MLILLMMKKGLMILAVVPSLLIPIGFDYIHNAATIIGNLFIGYKVLSLCQARHMLKQDRTIIHVEVKDTHEHFYFGSAAAMFEDSRVKHLLKIKYQTFRTKRISEDKPYENEFVIVRKGDLNTIDHSDL